MTTRSARAPFGTPWIGPRVGSRVALLAVVSAFLPAVLLFGWAQAAAADAAGASGRRPNLVFVFADDHAERAISACGGDLIRTPNLDRLAAEGAVFRNSFCANSICAPARATILTGKHSHRNGKRTNLDTFDPDQPTFPKALQAAGYQTALIGKWHLKADPQGFDHWEVLPAQGNYYNPEFRTAEGTMRREGYATDVITDRALRWLREDRDPSRPFALMVWHKAPHRTWAPAERHLDALEGRVLPEPATLFDDYSGRAPVLAANEMTIARHFYWDYDLKVPDSGLPDPFDRALKSPEVRRMNAAQRAAWDAAYGPRNAAFLADVPAGDDLVRWKYQRYLKDYLRCILAVDESVGRVLDALDGALRTETMIVYSSDQGFYLGEHGWYDKRWMFEESMRTPLLARWPGRIEAGREVFELVQNIDLAPTFLDAAGLVVPADMQGRSLLPVVAGAAPPRWRDQLYYAYYEEGEHAVPRHDGVRTARHKLICFPGADPPTTATWQLFDLQEDPHELRSVHDDPRYAAVLCELRARYHAARAEAGARPWPSPDEVAAGTGGPGGAVESPSRIEHREVRRQGFRILLDARLLGEEAAIGDETMRALEAHLESVARRVPRPALDAIREVPIFVDLDHPLATLQYHPSRGWLEEHGHDPAMTRAVHLPDARRFLALERSGQQPFVILHELAHAYHDQVLGFDDPAVLAAYRRAKASGRYAEVNHVSGATVEHYALTNQQEFFAELSESFFGRNDFTPVDRAAPRAFDEASMRAVAAAWGAPW